MADLQSRAVSPKAALPAHEEELQQEFAYRSVSWTAIAVLVASLFTPLAFLSQVGWILPLIVIVCGMLALRSLAANAERFTGARLVWIGLAISTLMLGWAPARYAARRHSLLGDARKVADAWAELVNHRDLQQAHQWHLSSAERAPEGKSLDEFYAEKVGEGEMKADRQKSLATFFDRKALAKWLQIDDAHAEYVGFSKQNSFSDAEEFILQYRVTGKQAGKEIEMPVYIMLVRRPIAPGRFEFTVGNVIDYDPVPLDDN